MSERKAALTGIYTLTPLHCGVGRAISAVDLPIAREAHTELPLIPSTSLKGVARAAMRPQKGDAGPLSDKRWLQLFGSEPPGRDKGARDASQEGDAASAGDDGPTGGRTSPGLIVFTEGRLLLLPARCLQRPFVYLTSPLLLDRLVRDRAAFGLPELPAMKGAPWAAVKEDEALVSDGALSQGPALMIEDRVYPRGHVRFEPRLERVATALLSLVPQGEAVARQRLPGNLVVVSDRELKAICTEAVPVVARTQLTDGKTTDSWRDDDGNEQSGNLWYQEQLPSDCLFYCIMTTRGDSASLRDAEGAAQRLSRVQIGGGETVGQGQCWWHVAAEGGAA